MIGVVGLRRDEERTEKEMASGGCIDWFVPRIREDEGDANRLSVAEAAEVETRSAQVPGMTVDRSQGC